MVSRKINHTIFTCDGCGAEAKLHPSERHPYPKGWGQGRFSYDFKESDQRRLNQRGDSFNYDLCSDCTYKVLKIIGPPF